MEFSNLAHDFCRVKILKKVAGLPVTVRFWSLLCNRRKEKDNISKSYDIFEKSVHNLREPPLVDPRVVEIDIFADLTISKEAKM